MPAAAGSTSTVVLEAPVLGGTLRELGDRALEARDVEDVRVQVGDLAAQLLERPLQRGDRTRHAAASPAHGPDVSSRSASARCWTTPSCSASASLRRSRSSTRTTAAASARARRACAMTSPCRRTSTALNATAPNAANASFATSAHVQRVLRRAAIAT